MEKWKEIPRGWFPNGQQQFDYNFRNNLEHGVCIEWNKAGEKVSELQFADGDPIQNILTGQQISRPGPSENSAPQEAQSPSPSEPAAETVSSIPKLPPFPRSQNLQLPRNQRSFRCPRAR